MKRNKEIPLQQALSADIQFSDIFDLADIQRLQDLFSDANGVASIITRPDGTPITKPSNFCPLCSNIIRKTEKGLANCYQSDAIIGRQNPSGPVVQPCLSGGLWDAGASITVGGKHIANWLIGQVRNQELDEQQMLQYADEIGANREGFIEALKQVPVMPVEQFHKVSKMLFAFANELSEKAYKNLLLKMQIVEGQKSAGLMQKNEELKLFRSLIEQSNDAIEVIDPATGRFLDANNKACADLGYSREELLSLKISDIDPTFVDESIFPNIQKELKKSDSKIFDSLNRRKDGSTFPVEINVKYIRHNRDYMVAIVRDITMRKQTENTILKANRLYAVISQVNQSIVRTSDREQLFDKVCRIAIEYGKFQMSWIGLVDQETKFINPVAYAGIENGYLSKTPKISISDIPEGRGPTGTAVHEGKYFVCKDIANDSAMALWKDEALKNGYRSSIALPIKPFGKVIGVFNIYSSTPNFFDQAEIELLTEVTSDISFSLETIETEKKRVETEKLLRESEERFRSLIDENVDSILVLDEAGLICFANPAAEVLFDRPMPYLLNTSLGIPIASGANQGIEIQLPHADGGYAVAEVHFVQSYWAGERVYIATLRDITARKHVEEALRNERTLLRTVIDNVPHLIYAKDLLCRKTLANLVDVRVMGAKSEAEVLGKDDFAFYPEEVAEGFFNDDLLVIQKGVPVINREEYVIDEKGEMKWLLTSKLPLRNKDNQTIGLVGIGRDITERKRVEKELIIAKEKAEESDRLKTSFLSNMSHEIRTPMNGILGFAEILKESDLTGEQRQEYLCIIQKSGERMLNIINNIIDISKIESGQMSISVSEININEHIEYIYNLFRPEAEKKGIQFFLKNQLPSNKAFIKTDRAKVDTILSNLIKNAIKFTSQGFIEFGCVKKGNYFEFFVKDSGIGICLEYREFIFERFRQGSESLNKKYEGAGLGLSISKACVEMLGGQIWVESEEGKGSEFKFTLPIGN